MIFGSWQLYSSQVTALYLLISVFLYQTSILLIRNKNKLFFKLTLLVVFIDGMLTGLLLYFCGFNEVLSTGISGLFFLIYVKTISTDSLFAVLGMIVTIYLLSLYSFPFYDVKESVENIILILMFIFFFTLGLIKYKNDKSLQEKLKIEHENNLSLRLHVKSLSKYLAPTLRRSIIAGNTIKVEDTDKNLTIFFSDIQGFSQLSEDLDPAKLSWLINSYLTEMSEIVFRFGGTLDKVIGDSIMVFFGDPNSRGAKNDAIACVCMAIAMKDAVSHLKPRWTNAGIKQPLRIRMGINSGNCSVGNFGTETKMDYTVLGSAVNLASHLESIAQPNEIVISEDTYNLVESHVNCTKKNLGGNQWLSKRLNVYTVNKISMDHNK